MPLYEGHVTIEPIPEEHLAFITQISHKWGFKPAKLLMQNRAKNTVERSMYDTFLTAHTDSLKGMELSMHGLCKELMAAGTCIWRYKIEQIILDSRTDDVLNLRPTPGAVHDH